MAIRVTGAVTVCGKNMLHRFFTELAGEVPGFNKTGGRESKTVELSKRGDWIKI